MAGPWVTEHEEKIVVDAIRNGWYGVEAYRYVETFEKDFAAYHGRAYGIMTPNCTTAIHLLLAALEICEGDEVIAPECTWIGSVAGITYLRAEPVFADVDPLHWCLTPESVERAITPRTKAVIVVDLFGNMPDWDALLELGKKHGVHIIEDAAEAVGSTYRGTPAGGFGLASVFSFHRTKTITTGEGGMLLLDDEDLYERCRFLRDHGRKPGTYFNTEVTFKYMPFNLQAALGWAQLQRIEELVARKRWMWNGYRERLGDVSDLYFNPEPDGGRNGVWTTALVFGPSHGMTREAAIEEMTRRGLPVRPFFYPLSSLPAYPGREERGRMDNPVAYEVSGRGINLPCAFTLTEAHLDDLCAGIKSILSTT